MIVIPFQLSYVSYPVPEFDIQINVVSCQVLLKMLISFAVMMECSLESAQFRAASQCIFPIVYK